MRTTAIRSVLLAVMVSPTLFFSGCGQAPEVAPPPPPHVTVDVITKHAVNPYKEFVGRIRAIDDAALVARVPGYIVSRDFKEGQPVEKDTVLFKLDPEEYELAKRLAEGKLKQAEAESQAAERGFKRAEELMKAKAIAAKDYDEAVNRRDQAAAAVEAAKADVGKAAYNLKHTEIRAPFKGRVSASRYSVGDFVSSQQELTSILTTDPMHVYMDLNEKEMVDVMMELGDLEQRRKSIKAVKVKLILPNGKAYDQVGKFDFFDNRVNPRTGSVKGRAVFPNPDLLLVAGQFVTVIAEQEQSQDRIVIPQASMQQDQLGAYVMLVGKDGKVEQRRITTGAKQGMDIIVVKGLEIGEKLIVEGLLKVRNGMPVQATERQAKPGAKQQQAREEPAEPAADKTEKTGSDKQEGN